MELLDDGLPRVDGMLIPADRASAWGVSATLVTARKQGRVAPVRRGVYIDRDQYDRASAVERHRLRALAVAHQRSGAVFAGFSAAVLMGLPVVGPVPDEIVVLSPRSSGRRRNGVVEIVRDRVHPNTVAACVATTSIVDTLIEVARDRPLLTALTMVDASLWVPRRVGGAALCTIDELREAFAAMGRFPGCRRVAAVLERASALDETPLETLSRTRFEELGFPTPQQQVTVLRPRSGRAAHLDFAWPEYGVWGEADGDGKYLGNARRNGDRRSAAVIVADEKRRENEVRAATGWTCARWDWGEAWRGAPLRGILLEAGLPIVNRPRVR